MFNRKSSYALNKKDPNAIVYMDANEAIIRLTREDRPEQPLRLLMTRHGLFDWKLSGVEFPPSSR